MHAWLGIRHDCDHRAPLGEARAEPEIVLEPTRRRPVLGYFFSGRERESCVVGSRTISVGARFAKWRAVIESVPGSGHAVHLANGDALARYSALCQEASIVPREPRSCRRRTRSSAAYEANRGNFRGIRALRPNVSLEHTVSQGSMVVWARTARNRPGSSAWQRKPCLLKRTVPAALPGVVFLSGGKAMSCNGTSQRDARMPDCGRSRFS